MADKDFEKSKLFTRRAVVLGGLKVGLLGVLATRLGYLQITEAGKYKMLSDRNRIDLRLLAPSRGRIMDRAHNVMANNIQDFRALLTPEQTDDMDATLDKLADLIGLEDHEKKRVMTTAKRVRRFSSISVKEGLSWDDVSKIEVNLPHLTGISTEAGETRDYPMGEATAHLIGYVGLVSEAEARSGDRLLTLPGFRIGKTGVEKELDEYLRGQAGTTKIEVNAVGRHVRELERIPSQSGDNVFLTIDAKLQEFTQKTLAQRRSASAVIMDAQNGAIYAMSSHPSFDPNIFNGRLSAETWEELLSDPAVPLTNKAVSGQYPPGSTFKMVVALAALETGVINENTRIHCPGHMDLGDHRFHCWKRGGHGTMNIVQALAESCDTYFYEICRDIGIDRIAAMARRLGLGERFDIEMSAMRTGIVPDRQWKMAAMGKTWTPGETIIASIGQGYTQSTPLQLAVMMARLVNGGKKVEPRLLYAIGDKMRLAKKEPESLKIAPRYLNIVRQGMDNVCNHRTGTAFNHRIQISGWEMGGKTGTSQVRRIRAEERAAGIEQDSLPWRERHHALFVGYAPLHNPRYICSVVVEHGGSGSSGATPLARDLLSECQRRRIAEFNFDLNAPAKEPEPDVAPQQMNEEAENGL